MSELAGGWVEREVLECGWKMVDEKKAVLCA